MTQSADPRELIREAAEALRKQLDFCHSPRTPVEYVDIGHAALRRADAWLAENKPAPSFAQRVIHHAAQDELAAPASMGGSLVGGPVPEAAPASEPVATVNTDAPCRYCGGIGHHRVNCRRWAEPVGDAAADHPFCDRHPDEHPPAPSRCWQCEVVRLNEAVAIGHEVASQQSDEIKRLAAELAEAVAQGGDDLDLLYGKTFELAEARAMAVRATNALSDAYAERDAAQAALAERDNYILNCPYCGEHRQGQSATITLSHLIACADRRVGQERDQWEVAMTRCKLERDTARNLAELATSLMDDALAALAQARTDLGEAMLVVEQQERNMKRLEGELAQAQREVDAVRRQVGKQLRGFAMEREQRGLVITPNMIRELAWKIEEEGE